MGERIYDIILNDCFFVRTIESNVGFILKTLADNFPSELLFNKDKNIIEIREVKENIDD